MTTTTRASITDLTRLQNAAKGSEIIEVPLDMMIVDGQFQRGINWAKVYQLVGRRRDPETGEWVYGHKWNRSAAGTLIGNMRDDNTISILDGQHRMASAKLAGETHMPTSLHYGLTLKEEAEIFVACNTVRARPSSGEVMRAKIVAGDTESQQIEEIVMHAGYNLMLGKIGRGTATSIRAVFAIRKLYDRGVLARTLRFLKATWPEDDRATEGEFLVGLGLVIQSYPTLEIGDFAEKMALFTVPSIIAAGNARAKTNRWSENYGIANTILTFYNQGKRTRRLSMELIDKSANRTASTKG